jgi:hypothetical protein
MARIGVGAFAFGQRGFSLGEEPDVVFTQLHEHPRHVGRHVPPQSSCAENFCVEFLPSIGVHYRYDEVIQMSYVTFSAHGFTLLLIDFVLPQDSAEKPSVHPSRASGRTEEPLKSLEIFPFMLSLSKHS